MGEARRAFVTGTSTGIGRVISLALAREGYDLAVMLERIPTRRFATPEEVAGAVVYLASPAASSVTGHTLLVDGGLTAY